MRSNFSLERRRKARGSAKVVRNEPADGDRAFLRLPFPDHEQRRHLGQRMFADLVIDLLVARVDLGADAGLRQLRLHLPRIIVDLVDDGRDDRLHRRQP